jgi:hypothetical protein
MPANPVEASEALLADPKSVFFISVLSMKVMASKYLCNITASSKTLYSVRLQLHTSLNVLGMN